MCRPFFPNVRPLTEEEIKLYDLSKCFKLKAYPVGKQNHMHVSFRQWPLMGTASCQNFIATKVSFQAFNKYSWPFGRWLASSHMQESDYCTQEDAEIASATGFAQDCERLMKLPEVTGDYLRSISQNPRSVRKVNLFKYELNDSNDNKGGICMTWGYSSKNMKILAASELGGLENARKYFSGFTVTFRAELFVTPKDTKIPPFTIALQTRTFKFNGNYSKDHHTSKCHHFSSKNMNFKEEFFTTEIVLPKPYENMLSDLIAKQNMEKRGKNGLMLATKMEQKLLQSQQNILQIKKRGIPI
ncbi:unnamed protein product [Allacma fusca]|uniref:Uncharacterized protein n=1 Tax=Allacma fusca TaxID=39272 RepID=A0A8J2K5Q5_9HEXA|nr:unnamed protein product [Allacma fusca]